MSCSQVDSLFRPGPGNEFGEKAETETHDKDQIPDAFKVWIRHSNKEKQDPKH